jgi:[protein-PII] uridylyltransferase
MDPELAREALLDRHTLRGREWCTAYREWADRWLAELFIDAGTPAGMALVAVGGYGRGDLCPESDLDVLLLHDGRGDIGTVAETLWYPVWDVGLKLGHAVRTEREALSLAAEDLDTATALLTSRHLAGDAALTATLRDTAHAQWRAESPRFLEELVERVAARHRSHGEVAFLLEPDLKEGRGGLRDVHAIQWLEAARGDSEAVLSGSMAGEYDTLLDIRVELHRVTGRAGDRLSLHDQDALADVLGDRDADALMARVASAARSISWTSDEVWERLRRSAAQDSGGRFSRLLRKPRAEPVPELGDGLVAVEGEVVFEPGTELADDLVWALRVGVAAAENDLLISRSALDRLVGIDGDIAAPWSREARDLFARLFLAGPVAVRVVEALDHVGLFVRLLPEWQANRSKPQRNAYHTYTVDRHLLEAASQASKLVKAVDRPDLLVVGALLHDIGKGYPGDHTEVGIDLVQTIGERMGYADDDVSVLVDMVRFHLLLPDAATRRDLDDDGTIRSVASQVRSPRLLALLDALTEADSIATGPAAWGPWKARLMQTLVSRTAIVLTGGDLGEVVDTNFPTDEHRRLMAAGTEVVRGNDDEVTVVAPDRPGLFSRVTGTLALHGLEVVEAQIDSDADMAVEVLKVRNAMNRPVPWPEVVADIELSLAGRLAIHARLVERAALYGKRTPRASGNIGLNVTFDNDVSEVATVMEFTAPDRVGLLFQVTQALSTMLLDIKSARVQTLGADVVDAFYLTDHLGDKITDEAFLAEIERAVLHSVSDA